MDRSVMSRQVGLRWRVIETIGLACLVLLAGCKSKEETPNASAAAVTGATAAVTQASWSPGALEELLAPIALYPDAILGQILAASVNSQEVLDGGNWLLEHQDLQGDALDAATKQADFGPAMQAPMHYPTVVDMMCQELDWTKQLGAAFTSDQKSVLDAVQRLRAQAVDIGNLESSDKMKVETKEENGQSIVELKPADPQVVYVPQYNPAAVYTTPPPAQATSSSSSNDDDDDDSNLAAGLLLFGAGMAIGAAINNNDCYPHYGYGAVYMGPAPFYPPAYVYRPMYPAYRPAGGYYPPAGYRHGYNHQTNIVINNNDYYNRFDHNTNLKGGDRSRSPIANTKHSGQRDRAGQSGRNTASNRATAGTRDVSNRAGGKDDWKGKSSYAGAKNKAGTSNRASTAARPSTGSRLDRGYGESSRGTASASTYKGKTTSGASARTSKAGTSASSRASGAAQSRTGGGATASRTSDAAGSGSIGSRASSGAGSGSAASHVSGGGASSRASRATSSQGSALSSASRSNSGSFERASSARGHASSGGSASRSQSGGGGGRAGGASRR